MTGATGVAAVCRLDCAPVRLLVGTSGWNYDVWKGKFYPADLPAARWLAFYAERFPTVEVNSTFYRHPKRETYDAWSGETPERFCFALKAAQGITHRRRLKDAEDAVRFFVDGSAALAAKRGPVLFQLPPNFKKDVERLRRFLGWVSGEIRAAFEFRHESWLDDEVFDLLRQAGAALCVADSEELATPCRATAPWGYLRLRREDYDDAAIDAWADKIRAAGWTDDVLVYFKHEDDAKGPRLADALRARF